MTSCASPSCNGQELGPVGHVLFPITLRSRWADLCDGHELDLRNLTVEPSPLEMPANTEVQGGGGSFCGEQALEKTSRGERRLPA